MPVTNTNLLADDLVARWLIENSPIKVPFLQAWVWQYILGKSLIYPRTPQLTLAQIRENCSVVPEFNPTIEQAEFVFADYIGRYSICGVDLDRFQHPNQLRALMDAQLKRQLMYTYAYDIVDPGNSRSLFNQCAPERIVSMGAGPLTLQCLDDAYERVTAGNGRPTLIMSSARALRTYRHLCREAGYKPERTGWRWPYNPPGNEAPDNVDSFNGTPWMVNGLIAQEGQPEQENIFFMVMGDNHQSGPTRGVTGIMPEAQRGRMFNKRVVEGILDPVGGGPGNPVMKPGVDVWISMPAGVALGSQGALSILTDFETVADCGGDGL